MRSPSTCPPKMGTLRLAASLLLIACSSAQHAIAEPGQIVPEVVCGPSYHKSSPNPVYFDYPEIISIEDVLRSPAIEGAVLSKRTYLDGVWVVSDIKVRVTKLINVLEPAVGDVITVYGWLVQNRKTWRPCSGYTTSRPVGRDGRQNNSDLEKAAAAKSAAARKNHFEVQ